MKTPKGTSFEFLGRPGQGYSVKLPESQAAGGQEIEAFSAADHNQNDAGTKLDRALNQDIVLVEKRRLVANFLAAAIRRTNDTRVMAFPTVAGWLEVADDYAPGIILLSLHDSLAGTRGQADLLALLAATDDVPVIVTCDQAEPELIVAALQMGIRGYIPSETSLDVAAQIIRLVLAGGEFVPVSVLTDAISSPRPMANPAGSVWAQLTPRQIDVVKQLCRGLTNREIGRELNMQESTVKVHIRSAMKRLSAKNRTELVVITTPFLADTGKEYGA